MKTSRRLVAAWNRTFRGGSGRKDEWSLDTPDSSPTRLRLLLPRLIFPVVFMALLALVLCSGLASAAGSGAGESAGAGGPSSTSVGAAQVPKAVEIKSARTATSDTFALLGGERETRSYAEPVNYKDEEGGWKPIGEGLEETEGGDLTNGANSFDLTLPRRLGAEVVRIEGGGEWISDRLVGRDTEAAQVEGDTATYEGATPGTTFELTSVPTGVKEAIEIEGPSGPSSFSYELDASQGLTPTLEKDGSVVFRRRDESVAAVLPAPTVIDGAPGAEPDPEAVSYGLEALSDGGWRLELTVDPHWLSSPGRVWPATIDPTIEVRNNGSESCEFWMKEPSGEAGPDFECSSYYPKVKAEYSSKAGVTQRYRSLISFAHTEIEHDAWIGSASVNLYDPEEATGLGAVELRPVTKEWNSTANWIYYSYLYGGGKAWEHPGGDFTNEVSELSTAERGTAPGWWHFTKGMTQIVRNWENSTVWNDPIKNWIKSTTEHGLLVKLANESPCGSSCSDGTFSFLSENSSNPAEERPYLAIDYYPKAPSSSKVVSPTEGTRTARRLKLRSKWTAAGVEGVTWQYREGKSGPFETIPAELVRNTEGKTVSWPIPVSVAERETKPLYLDAAHVTPTLRKKGGVIQVRALFEGPTEVAGYSAPVEAVVNRSLGGPKDATASVGPGSVDLLTGNLSTSDSDVSIPTFNSGLEFSRTFNSRGLAPKGSAEETEEEKSALGPGWKPGVPVEEAGGSEWRNLKIVEEKGNYEEEIGEEEIVVQEYSFTYAILTDLEGAELAFEKTPGGYVAPPEVTGWSLTTAEGNLVLSDPAGDRTTFSNPGGGNEYVPTAISQAGGSGVTTTRVEYELKEGKKRLHMVVAPSPSGVNCTSQEEATSHAGCRTLILTYGREPRWELPEADGERLEKITYYAPGNGGPWEVARYEYDKEGRLTEEWDPRITPELKEKYAYGPNGELKTITPPGQEPWTLEYGTVDEEEGIGRLTAVKRPSLLASPTTAQTTIAYEVPLSGSPYEMGGAAVAQWGQTDIPVDATAIFPPDQVPSSPPSSYSHATVYYMDAEGHEVNVATPSGAGTSNPSISTGETDEYGNVVRELTPDNRLRVLAEPECKVFTESGCKRRERAEQLETKRVFGAEGTQLEEEIGPLHKVRLESGSIVEARSHKVVQYDHEMPVGTTPDPHLPTRETTGASVEGVLHDERVREMKYDWTLRRPEKSIVVMESGKPNIESVTRYDDTTGLPTETRQPKEAKAGGGAGTTKTIYYGTGHENIARCEAPRYAGLPCKTEPAAQPGTSGQPEILVKKFKAYDGLGQPTEVSESPGGVETETQTRTTRIVYDPAGRELTTKIEGGGTAITKSGTTETVYSTTLGLPTIQRFVCEKECTGFDNQATTTTYDALGRPTEYEDADGNKTKTTYDVDGRPVTTTDNKGSQTITYDPTSGLPTQLEDSGAGIFTASYDADGNMVERTLPDGLTAKTTYNEVDEPMSLAYTKSGCVEHCTWYEESLERSVYGQILSDTGNLVSDRYAYDKDGRLTQTQETPAEGGCTTREYKYDEDSNRTLRTVREPGIGGLCATSGGSEQKYEYDAADRLLGTGLTYDEFGRITSLPAVDAGGHALNTTYYSTNMIATQEQNGTTNSYELDATGRQRARLQSVGGLKGTEVFHYDGPSDSVAWAERGTSWTRDIGGIGGELVAVQEKGPGVTLQLTDLHGDVVATAEPSPTATKLKATFRFDEFGEPESASAGRFGWLGGKSRRTELSSGVIQMGARSYIPQLGRFLTPDPVPGGSANPYDYANQDPVNGFDLEGNCSTKKKCQAQAREQKKRVEHRVDQIRRSMSEAQKERQAKTATTRGNYGGIPITLPWEHQIDKVVGGIEEDINGLLGESCMEKGETLGAVSGLATGGKLIARRQVGRLALRVASWLSDIADGSALAGTVLWVAGKAGYC